MLSIKGLNYAHDSQLIFDQLDLDVANGQHVVIVGNSGGGKSTLLTLIADHKKRPAHIQLAGSTAMVLQEGALLDELSVQDNLSIIARYNKIANSSAPILGALNIEQDLLSKPVANLSGGQKRRIAIARALISRPDLLLFDEPDAGLDVENLGKLANIVNASVDDRASITVSHNPIYIAKIAHKVYRLSEGRLFLLASWEHIAKTETEQLTRQHQLQAALGQQPPARQSGAVARPARLGDLPVLLWLNGVWETIRSLPHWPRSLRDEVSTAFQVMNFAFFTGILFFALVGLMLGATTIAVVRLLADNTLTGFIGFLLNPEDLIDMMGGVYVVYLAPPIGGMLFAARSGSIVCNWLGERVRSKQTQALQFLGVPVRQYLRAPAFVATFASGLLAMLWFSIAVWLGGVLAVTQLFEITNPSQVMEISRYDLKLSNYWEKLLIYSGLLALTIIALGLAKKTTSADVNTHTTKAIIYSTLLIATTELSVLLLR